MSEIKEPYYMIEFNVSGSLVDFRVNDIQVLYIEVPGQLASRIPVNYAIIKNGIQEISIRLSPIVGTTHLSSTTKISYSVQLYDVLHSKFVLKETFGEFKSKKIDKVESFTNSSVFQADVPYQILAQWENGVNLNNMEGLSEKIRNAYIDLGNIITNGKFDLFKERMLIRESNMATSMYLSKLESNNRIQRLIEDLNSGFDFKVFDQQNYPVISAYGKKVSLRKQNGEPALSFINKKINEEIVLDVEFYFSKETYQFEII